MLEGHLSLGAGEGFAYKKTGVLEYLLGVLVPL